MQIGKQGLFKSFLRIGVALAAASGFAHELDASVVVYQTGFQAPTFTIGNLAGQNAWTSPVSVSSNAAQVVSVTGGQEVQVNGAQIGLYSGNNLYDCSFKKTLGNYYPVGSGTPIVDISASLWQQMGSASGAPNVFVSLYDQNTKIYGSLGINASGQAFAQNYNSPNNLVNNGRTATNGFHNFELELNYTNQTMALFEDGLFIGSIPFNTSASNELGSLVIVEQCANPITSTLLMTNVSVTAGTVATPTNIPCQLIVSSAGPCLPGGAAGTPSVGSTYQFNADFKVIGQPTNSFRIEFTMANVTNYFTYTLGPGTNYHVPSPSWSLNLDDPIPWSITLDPDAVSGNINLVSNTASGTFTPVPPATAVELYSPRWLYGYESYQLNFQPGSGTIGSLWVVSGVPSVHGAQSAVNTSPPADGLFTNVPPYGVPVCQITRNNAPAGTFEDTNYFAVQVNRMRVNPSILRTNTWADLAAMSTNWTQWLAADSMCESTNPVITNFVYHSLPANYQSVLTPYDTARILHRAVEKALVYEFSTTNVDAVTSLQNGTTDCGGYAHLLVASLRCVGIPARSISGFWIGVTNWHVRAEFHLPDVQWVLADACLGSETDQTGTYAYYFGDVNDSDQYLAMDVGDSATLPYAKFSFLQLANWTWTGGAVFNSAYHDAYMQPMGVLCVSNLTPSTIQLNYTDAPARGTVVLQTSSNLMTWTSLATNSPAGTNLYFSYPVGNGSQQYYRTSVSP